MRWSSMSTSEEQPNGQGASHTTRNKSRIPVIPKSTFFNTRTCINFNSGSSDKAASHTNNKVSVVLKTVCLHVGESCNGAQSERNQQYLAIGQLPRRQFHKSVVKAERKKIIVFWGVISRAFNTSRSASRRMVGHLTQSLYAFFSPCPHRIGYSSGVTGALFCGVVLALGGDVATS